MCIRDRVMLHPTVLECSPVRERTSRSVPAAEALTRGAVGHGSIEVHVAGGHVRPQLRDVVEGLVADDLDLEHARRDATEVREEHGRVAGVADGGQGVVDELLGRMVRRAAQVGDEHLGKRAHLDRGALHVCALLPGVATVAVDLRDALDAREVRAGDALPRVQSAFVLRVPRAGYPLSDVRLLVHRLDAQVAAEGPEDAAPREQALVRVSPFEILVDDTPSEVVAVPGTDAGLIQVERSDGHQIGHQGAVDEALDLTHLGLELVYLCLLYTSDAAD